MPTVSARVWTVEFASKSTVRPARLASVGTDTGCDREERVILRATELAGFVGAALAGIAYVPQISHLAQQHCAAGISRFAFGVWLAAPLLVMTRAFAIHATVFIVLGVIQVLATAVICVYAKIYDGSYCETHLPVAR